MSFVHKEQRFKPLPHYKNGRYFNPHQKDTKRKLWNILLWQLGYYDDPAENGREKVDFSYPELDFSEVKAPPCTAQWINHSSFLIDICGCTFLTDPIWGKRASPLTFLGPKRKIPPGIRFEELPAIDYILISHDHYDHLDAKIARKLIRINPNTRFIVPMGLKKWLIKRGARHIVELDWGEAITIQQENRKIVFTCVPAQHFSGRSLFNRNKTLWCGWVVEYTCSDVAKRFYFAGDTGYNNTDFRTIGNFFHTMDLSIIPIGSYIPKKFMAPVHIGPEEAVRIHQDIHSRLSVAAHFGTFRLSEEHISRPKYDLFCTLQKAGIPWQQFLIPQPGKNIMW